jgi:hypothetical protein
VLQVLPDLLVLKDLSVQQELLDMMELQVLPVLSVLKDLLEQRVLQVMTVLQEQLVLQALLDLVEPGQQVTTVLQVLPV